MTPISTLSSKTSNACLPLSFMFVGNKVVTFSFCNRGVTLSVKCSAKKKKPYKCCAERLHALKVIRKQTCKGGTDEKMDFEHRGENPGNSPGKITENSKLVVFPPTCVSRCMGATCKQFEIIQIQLNRNNVCIQTTFAAHMPA